MKEDDGMDFPLLYRRYLHIVAVEVGEIGVGVVRRHEVTVLKVDGREGEHTVLPVHDTIAVVDEDIGDISVMRSESESDGPSGSCYQVFGTKPPPLCCGTQRVMMRFVQDGIAFGDSETKPLGERFRYRGIIDEWEDVDIESFLIVGGKIITRFHIERVEVAHFDNRLFAVRLCAWRL